MQPQRFAPKREIIGITPDRQFTIPEKYFSTLGFRSEAECFYQDGGLFIRPLQNTMSGEFAEHVLADLISQGYEGQELLKKFREKSLAIRPAVKKLIEEADQPRQQQQEPLLMPCQPQGRYAYEAGPAQGRYAYEAGPALNTAGLVLWAFLRDFRTSCRTWRHLKV